MSLIYHAYNLYFYVTITNQYNLKDVVNAKFQSYINK